jgi:hypothetical protein
LLSSSTRQTTHDAKPNYHQCLPSPPPPPGVCYHW